MSPAHSDNQQLSTISRLSRNRAGDEIVANLTSRIRGGEWPVGARLPSIRKLSQEFGVAPLTISRAFNRLESDGLIAVSPNRGAFVREPAATRTKPEDMSWQRELFRRRPPRSFSVTLPSSSNPDAVNLATGTMSNEAVPLASIRRAIRRTSERYVEGRVSERPAQGELELREAICNITRGYGIHATPQQTLIVSSTHQAFRIVGSCIIDHDDYIAIESPSDPIVMGTFENLDARCVPVEIDANGVAIERARAVIERYKPKAFVTCSSGQIPTGVTTSATRREELYQLCKQAKCLLIEYDNGNEVWYEAPPPRPIMSLDDNGTVVYVREFGRESAAGIRISCVQASGPIFARLIENKRRDDLLTSSIGQYEMLEYLRSGDYAKNLPRLREFYRERRAAAIDALHMYMPPGFHWYNTNVGFHLWLMLPSGMSARRLAQEAAIRGVIVAPSEVFSIDGKLDNAVRITFGDNPPPLLVEGIKRLAATCEWLVEQPSANAGQAVFQIV